MGVDLAVSPTVKTPGIFLTVNLLAGASSPGLAAILGLLIAPRSTVGTLVANAEVRLIASPDDARAAWGPKTPGFLAARAFFARNTAGILYGIAPLASGGAAAAGQVTFASTPTISRTVHWDIAGKTCDVAWAAGEDSGVITARCVAALNARDDIPATASSSGAGVLVLTFPVPGPWGNDVLYAAVLVDGAGGTATAAGPGFTGGTTEPDFTTALEIVSGTKYDYITPCLSNADAQAAGAATNVARLRSHINGANTGRNAMLQQAIVGMTGTLSAAKAGAIARNDPVFEFPFCMNGRGLPSELGGEELGARMASVALDPAANRIETVLQFAGAANLVLDTPTLSECEDALSNGVSIVSYNRQGEALLVRPITSHSQDQNGNPDGRCFDVSGVDGSYAIANDLEIFLPVEYRGAKIVVDLKEGDELPPAGVVQPRDIKCSLTRRLDWWVKPKGVARRDKLDEAIAKGTLSVEINSSDETQVDIAVPLAIVKPLAKIGVVINKVA